MEKPADFILSADADADLDEIREFTVEKWGEAKAPEYLESVFAAFAALALQPHLGPARPELGEFVRVLTVGQHLIFYEPHPARHRGLEGASPEAFDRNRATTPQVEAPQ